MELTEATANRYAKKILGFACSKTHSVADAEDLSQEIILNLAETLPRYESIDDLDGFVFTVSRYTWSKFVRKNMPRWRSVDLDAAAETAGGRDVAEDLERRALIERVRAEVAYLSKLRREITLLFYFDNMRGEDIAKKLGLPHGTVRWHLGEIRKNLREDMMTKQENLGARPRRLMITYWGDMDRNAGLGGGGLPDNIMLACYGGAKTIGELARELCVAAAYVEPHVEELLYMDYLAEKNGRYRANFPILTWRDHVVSGLFAWDAVEPFARRLFAAVDARLDKIRRIGFLGSDLGRDFLLWALLPDITQLLFYASMKRLTERSGLNLAEPPIHADGTRHWIWGTLCEKLQDPLKDEWFRTQTEFTPEQISTWQKTLTNGVKPSKNGIAVESRASIEGGYPWRCFDDGETAALAGFAELQRQNKALSDVERLSAARFVVAKFMETAGDAPDALVPKLMIPALDAPERAKLLEIYGEIQGGLGGDFFVPYIERFADMSGGMLPPFLPQSCRDFMRYTAQPHCALLYRLADLGLLKLPQGDDLARMCAMVWA